MKTKKQIYRYLEWKSPEEMHETSLEWISQLKFVKDEQLFLNDLIKSYTLQITSLGLYEESKELVTAISNSELEAEKLLKKAMVHENQLSIMLDDIDQPKMEKAYTESHRDMIYTIDTYLVSYRKLKGSLFQFISKIMKKEKQKRLLN
ncbi:hypothetical protein HZY62_10685 [Maribacter polysiphoniae]|uniref:Uncharacterized protein n=1 Tax=Maribacter polysiphoniae TaxID=429344 RepID=A0A316DZW5_9FLAO|nr:hypothetical protein [Maribacter polysiphoniae]MBD1261055.1 hypothetical protein [Maribacter polysiphoniae]PWK23704.1 hypothetical protein LX92_02271 [Maribacter polysiphoniae]